MEELSVMMWRTNLADAVAIDDKQPIKDSPTRGNIPQVETTPRVPPQILAICGDTTRLNELAAFSTALTKSINLRNMKLQISFSSFLSKNPIVSSFMRLC
ncbi:hypothetical protein PITC_040080 [Penicillium italicum]|uniref:Uncharacterized protein n=1 Tax=Penicillium italicum TaxID=40296 RepID=A0A0A2L472_PENIT|nr:hypothetical protein PITC_040080 [Penicillium italicum]